MDANTDETLLLRFQRSLSLDTSSDYGGPSSSVTAATNTLLLVRSTAVWVAFGCLCWFYPRYLIAHETTIFNKVPPYQQTAAGDVLLDFSLNEKLVDPPTIPSAFLVFTSVWAPLLIAAIHAWVLSRRTSFQWLEVATVLCAFSMAIGLSEGATQLLKLLIQRRRPNFYQLCGFDKNQLKCVASLDRVREANFSFPSGHSSLACCGMTFLVWHFLGKSKGRRFTALASTVLPWGWAILVAASRIVDKWHHPSDILAGLGLGFATCTIAYHTWYPPVWTQYAGVPRTLLQELDASNKLPSFSE